MAERCVCCGEIIPEGRQVCPNCEHKAKEWLKPCPFCGGPAKFIGETNSIKCTCCGGAFLCTNPLMSRLEVKEVWNRRVDDGKAD